MVSPRQQHHLPVAPGGTLKSLFDDLGHEEHEVKQVVGSVLAKLPGEHAIRAIDLNRELEGGA